MRSKSLAGARWATAGMLMVTLPTTARAAEPAVLQIVLVDVEDRLGAATGALERELNRQLQTSERRLEVRRSAQRSFAPARELGVILVRRPQGTPGLSRGVMGAVRRSPGAGGLVWIYVDNVLRTLGLDPADAHARQRHSAAIGRAIGRVLAHEIAHLLLPGRDHDESGLMAARLSGSDLGGSEVLFDTHTRAALLTAHLPAPH